MRITYLSHGLLVLVLAVTGAGGAALAQENQDGTGQGSQQAPMQQLQQYRQEIQQLNQQLFEIQQSTLEANPDLAEQREELIDTVDAEMKKAGVEPQATRDRIEDMQQQLQTGDLSEEERQAVTQELREAQGSLQQAQQQAMQNEEIRKAQQELSQNLVTAMTEQEPSTEQLLADLQQARQAYRSLLQNAMQQQQQQQQQ